MAQGRLTGAEDRDCVICGNTFTPARRKQEACPPSTGRTCAMKLSNLKRGGTRNAAGKFDHLKPEPRQCEKCGRTFQPKRVNSKTCGADCPGKPDETRTCANPICSNTFTVTGRPGTGRRQQKYCSRRCRDQVATWRMAERFRRYNGMTVEEFHQRAEAQNGKCMICGKEPVPDSRSRREGIYALEVDHDHATGATRDLLCGHCNRGIGHLMDDPDLLRAAADYIERHRHRA